MTDGPIAIVDVGVGNLRSVERAVRHALGDSQRRVLFTGDPGAVREAATVVMPGQGGFGDCAMALSRDGGVLARALTDHIAAGRPYLGICLGLQVLFEGSEEAPGRGGLGVFRGTVRRFREGATAEDGTPAKIPHVGWNRVVPREDNPGAVRWLPPGGGAWFYFVHSYFVVPADPSLVAATSTHGEAFTCAIARGALLGVQFHPEKSQTAGISLLQRFLGCGEASP